MTTSDFIPVCLEQESEAIMDIQTKQLKMPIQILVLGSKQQDLMCSLAVAAYPLQGLMCCEF